MSIPIYGSIKNQENVEYRTNKATHMQKNFSSPDCLFNFIADNSGFYAIKNVKNNQYLQSNISQMSPEVKGDSQKWKLLAIPNTDNGFYVQNVKNNEYLTKKASQLSKNAGQSEIYVIEERSE